MFIAGELQWKNSSIMGFLGLDPLPQFSLMYMYITAKKKKKGVKIMLFEGGTITITTFFLFKQPPSFFPELYVKGATCTFGVSAAK
jgi:hypothetical protein